MGKILFIILLFFVSGCNSYQQNALVGDFQTQDPCPDGGCVNTDLNIQDLYIQPSATQVYFKVSQSSINLSGTCGAGNYKNSIIEILTGSSLTSVAANNIVVDMTYQQNGERITNKSYVARCVKGKFNFLMDKTSDSSIVVQLRILGCSYDSISDCGTNFTDAGIWKSNNSNTGKKVVKLFGITN